MCTTCVLARLLSMATGFKRKDGGEGVDESREWETNGGGNGSPAEKFEFGFFLEGKLLLVKDWLNAEGAKEGGSRSPEATPPMDDTRFAYPVRGVETMLQADVD